MDGLLERARSVRRGESVEKQNLRIVQRGEIGKECHGSERQQDWNAMITCHPSPILLCPINTPVIVFSLVSRDALIVSEASAAQSKLSIRPMSHHYVILCKNARDIRRRSFQDVNPGYHVPNIS